jgi:hypothetical protein
VPSPAVERRRKVPTRVVDDLPVSIPLTKKELEVVENYLGDDVDALLNNENGLIVSLQGGRSTA